MNRRQLLGMFVQYLAGLFGAAVGGVVGTGVVFIVLLHVGRAIGSDQSSTIGLVFTIVVIMLVGLFAGAHYGTVLAGRFWNRRNGNNSNQRND
jgi:hypothetical protein